MNLFILLALLGGGITLSVFGVRASESFNPDFSSSFPGSLRNKSVWLLIGGVIVALAGLLGLLRRIGSI